MRTLLVSAIVFLFPLLTYSHPGKTDYRDGHKCWNNCSEWELEYQEYHLHDKDWNPIRLDKKGNRIKESRPEQMSEAKHLGQAHMAATTGQEYQAAAKISGKLVNQPEYNTIFFEEGILPFNISLLFLLALLLLLVLILIFIMKKREKS